MIFSHPSANTRVRTIVYYKKFLEKSDPPFVCVGGEGYGQVRTSGGVYHSSLKAKPEMMIVAHDIVHTCMDTAAKMDFGSVPIGAGTKSAGCSRQVAKCRIGFSRND